MTDSAGRAPRPSTLIRLTRSRRGRATVAGIAALALASAAGAVAMTSPAEAAIGPDVRISELTNGGPAGSSDNFIEITNYGDAPADLDGWEIYRCAATGSRVYDPQVPPLSGVSLDPGETFVVAHLNSSVVAADVYYDVSLANAGFGAWIQDANRRVIDSVAVYANPVDSECGMTGFALPNTLDYRAGHSYQRIGLTGDNAVDFIPAVRTPGAPNATAPAPGIEYGDVLISELTNGGAAGSSDNFVEIANFGDDPVDIGGWALYRCTADGRRHTSTLQNSVPDDTVLKPGASFVFAHDVVSVPTGVAHVRYDVSLANAGFGAAIENADGVVVDAVGVYETDGIHQAPVGSPCAQGTALPNRLEYGFDQTYQRFQSTGDNAADFRRATRTIGELVLPDAEPAEEPFEFGPVQISELINNGPAGGTDNYFELANFGDEPVALQGWTIHRCQADGRRNPSTQIPVIGDVTLQPGETYLAVRSGSPLHQNGDYDAVYGTSFAADGFGLIVYDADGDVVDSVGIYGDTYSPCTKDLAVMNVIDTGQGLSFQRYRSTGNDAQDFTAAVRTPGELPSDLRGPTDFTADELAPVDVEPAPRPLAASDPAVETGPGSAALSVSSSHTTGDDVQVTFRGAQRLEINAASTHVYTGVSEEAPPTTRKGANEQLHRGWPAAEGAFVAESTTGFPYQRYEVVITSGTPRGELELAWSGRSTGRNELQMYAWNHRDQRWDLVDAAGGIHGGEITLTGAIDADLHVRGRRAEVLVQDGPATGAAYSDDAQEPNLAFKNPEEYDFAFGYMTDTQFLSEGYRSTLAEFNRWLVTNAGARNIAYTFHTGDITQRWMNGTHGQGRARDEFRFASEAMGILDDAGHPYGVLPGNHDNKWGRENELYNEYFSVNRYQDNPWYGGPSESGDNTNHYDVMEIGGAPFLMVYIGYFGGADAIDWANRVIAEHPDHNVVVATHEYMHADGSLSTPDTYRWTSLGERYWNELILPNANVFLVLAGHFHGVALNIKRDVGGVAGRVVVEMLANYQNFERNGLRNAGFLRLLQVDVDAKQMGVNTYAPLTGEHNAWRYDPEGRYGDADDEFTVEVDLNDTYDKRVESDDLAFLAPTDVIGTATVAAGEKATVDWDGLRPGSYTWFAESSDAAGTVAVSPAWTFEVPR